MSLKTVFHKNYYRPGNFSKSYALTTPVLGQAKDWLGMSGLVCLASAQNTRAEY